MLVLNTLDSGHFDMTCVTIHSIAITNFTVENNSENAQKITCKPIAKNTTNISQIIYHKCTINCDIVPQKCDIVPQNRVFNYKM